ncbi:MAG: hypothetical protein OHK0029_02390 [Armatimonadaceae bacterium]
MFIRNAFCAGASLALAAVFLGSGASPVQAQDQGGAPSVAVSVDGKRYAAITGSKIQVYSTQGTAPVTLQAPEAAYTALAFSPDGSALAAATGEGVIQRFSLFTRSPIGKALNIPTGDGANNPVRVTALAFGQDGSELIAVDSNNKRLVRFKRPEPRADYKFQDVTGLNQPLVAFSRDNKGGWVGVDPAGTLHLFNSAFLEIGTLDLPEGGAIRTVAVTPDAEYLLTGSPDRVRLWIFQGAEVARLLGRLTPVAEQKTTALYPGAGFEPDGKAAVLINPNYSRQNWEVEKAKADYIAARLAANTETPKPDPVKPDPVKPDVPDVKPTPTPTEPNKPVEKVKPAEPKPAEPKPAEPKPAEPKPVEPKPVEPKPAEPTPKPEEPRVATNPAVKPEPALPRFTRVETIPGHLEIVNTVAYDPTGKYLASGSRDNTVQIWDAARGTRVRLIRKHSNYVSSVAFSPDGKKLVSGGWDNKIYLWNVPGNENSEPAAVMDGHTSIVLSVAFNQAGDRIVSGSNDRSIILWNAATGKPILRSRLLPDAVASAVFSPDGKLIAGGCLDGKVYIWDAATLELKGTLVSNPAYPIYTVTFVGNGGVVAGGKNGFLRYWSVNAPEGKGGVLFQTDGKDIFAVTYNAKKRLLAAGGGDKLIRVYMVPTNLSEWAAYRPDKIDTPVQLSGHQDTVRALDFDLTGEQMVSGGWDFNILVWRLAGANVAQNDADTNP